MKLPIVFLAVLGLACGKSLPTRNLNDDLNDFLALVPLDEVLGIVLDYLANDQEVQELILYLQSEEFHKIVITVEELDEFKLLIKIPEELGIDVNSIINLIHEIIGLPPYAARKNTRRGVGLNGLIDDLIAILPIDDLKALFEKKQQTSPDFKALIDAIQSPEFKSILDKLESLPEFQKLLQNLRDKGVDVDHIIEFLKALFGLSRRGTRSLKDDLKDLLDVIPHKEIGVIVLDYVLHDREVSDLAIHVQSPEFRQLVEAVVNSDELKDIIAHLRDQGVVVISQVNELLGFPALSLGDKATRRGEGVKGLVDDVIKVLPVERLKEIFRDKLLNSADFRRLIDVILSPDFKELVRRLKATSEFKELEDDLRNRGVDRDYIIQRLKEAFGLSQRGTRNLNDDLNDFLALVPLDEVIAIVLDYLANDQEVQELILYLQSEEFHKIVITVEELDEFKLLIKIPEELGIDVNSIINLIHEIIGLPPYAARKNTRRGVGLNGLIDDLIAILPIDDLKALFEKKQQTSPDFKALIDAIQSPEFKSILDKLESLPEFQKLLQNLRDKGVDVDHIIELLKALFGLSRRGTRNLNDDLNDFLALVPLDEVIAIVLDYLANDQEVQELILYLQSEEFHKIVITVEELDEFKLLIKIPEELGIDVNSIINLIHEIIGLPPYAARKNTRRGVGLNGLIDDLIAILPIDDLKALFEKKQQTSPDFKALIDAIQSPEFKSILDKLESLPEFQKLLQNLRDKGVDVDHIIELLKALFGLSRH
ncbi:uncharacterized protein LOC111862841 isoform X2 [Cryptotermes secundus]|uniref:uncharacterized protein LOC111862841 isoform X2 n=1 Tax=Cryptotermes secundus TaxID=105785 RepID=UPI001454D633|nr:uncharacterized protein LOC111862841 isoform X2 [Cryptotermes secundus]